MGKEAKASLRGQRANKISREQRRERHRECPVDDRDIRRDSWARLTPAIRKRIDNKLARYAQTGAGDVKSLSGREGARLRVGDWRVIFTEDPTTIIVVAVGHRGEIYED
jgi:mRNA interferase RelE/StbE